MAVNIAAIFLLFFVLLFAQDINGDPNPKYRIEYIEQDVDHFSWSNEDIFKMRYVISDQHWDSVGGGPIFFYCGNEGDIITFVNNTGFMWEAAPAFKAMVVFGEHRYYGESLPYGKDSFKDPAHYGYLTAEQALADFAALIRTIKETTPGAAHSPVVAFGGSYGGMLAAWFRIKYPNIVAGALAASAPILWFEELTPCVAFTQIVTKDFTKANPVCPQLTQKSWPTMNNMAKTEKGLKQLTDIFHLCDTLKSVDDLKEWITDTYGNMAMVNYPYPTSFLAPLPAWPINVACTYLSDPRLTGVALLTAVYKSVSVFHNYTGNTPCYHVDDSLALTAGLDDNGWECQTCNEMVMPMCTDGVNDMFEPKPWNLTLFIEGCQTKWKTTPRPAWITTQFGGLNITAASNIIFSNGDLDPWSGGGVTASLSDSLVSIYIENSAHHLDLRSSNPADPVSVTNARNMEKNIISKWVSDYQH